MKNHLQSHIKSLIRHNTYHDFTAEPVVARQRRLATETNVDVGVGTAPLKVKTEASQGSVEKENLNVRSANRKLKQEAFEQNESKHFLAEISNDPSCPQAKRHKTEVTFYDAGTDVVIRPKFGVGDNSATVRHFKTEFDDESTNSARSTPSDDIELIPYCSSVTFADPVSVKIETTQPMPILDSISALKMVNLDHCYLGHISDPSRPTTDAKIFRDLDDPKEIETSDAAEIFRLKRIVEQQRRLEPEIFVLPCELEVSELLLGASVELQTSPETESGKFEPAVFEKLQKVELVSGSAAASLSSRSEADKVSEAVKNQALAAIQDLQARGITTNMLTCSICDPAKTFTAYTTLLTHLRSHAQIR